MKLENYRQSQKEDHTVPALQDPLLLLRGLLLIQPGLEMGTGFTCGAGGGAGEGDHCGVRLREVVFGDGWADGFSREGVGNITVRVRGLVRFLGGR